MLGRFFILWAFFVFFFSGVLPLYHKDKPYNDICCQRGDQDYFRSFLKLLKGQSKKGILKHYYDLNFGPVFLEERMPPCLLGFLGALLFLIIIQ